MSVLTENIVLSRTRAQDLNSVRKLNCWGSELSDVSLVRKMPFVEVLSLSVNSIETLLDFSFCKNLQELYIRKNCITDLNEVIYLKDLPRLKSLWLADNPCAECDEYRLTVLRTLPNLQKLDNINVQPHEVEVAKNKGKILIEPSEKNEDEQNEQNVPVQTQPTHVKKEKVEEVYKAAPPDKNQNQELDDVPKNHPLPPNTIFENAVPKQAKAHSPPKPEPINRDVHAEEIHSRASTVQNQQYIHNQQSKPQLHPEVTVHRQMLEQREQHVSSNSVSTSSSSTASSQHVNHAFYARVQTLVDHSSRKPRKPADLRCEGRSNKSVTSSPPPPLPSNGVDESPDNFQLDEGQFYGQGGGPGARDLSELETRSCSLDSEASYYLEQRAAGNTSRTDKNSPTRILPKGGRNRNSNILSAVLCLIKELDFASLEVVETAIHCQMEDMENP